MRAQTLGICAVGFLGGALLSPVALSSFADHPAASHLVSAPTHVLSAPVAATKPHLAANRATYTLRQPAQPAPGFPSGYYGTTPATFLGLQDNGCVFFVTTSQAAAASWTGASDPRSRPCTPTVNSFNPIWSSTPTRAQQAAWRQETEVLASQYPDITLQQAQPLVAAALANVQN